MNKNVLNHWANIAPLLDELLTLTEAERLSFLDGLPPAQRAWRAALEQLLRSDAAAASAGFMQQAASLPDLTAGDAATAHDTADWRPEQILGPWRLIRELGRGGMASVWLARPATGEFQREVALKLPHSPAPHLAERFRRERDVLARLSHPGIARLFDAGVTPEGLPWLALEWVDGQDLLAWCAKQHATMAQRVDLLLQVADALQYAHGRLVIHRDIKPANVLVQQDGPLGKVRLLDFGIARLLDDAGPDQPALSPLTQLGQRPMTPEYASPEQVRGEEPGVASDVYALGVLAYRLLSGHSPYAAAAVAHRPALEQAILEFQTPPPSQQTQDKTQRKALRGDLDTIVLKALAKEPGQRYATVDALAADLRRHLAGVPVLARGPSWRYGAGRFVRRHRLGVAASALAVAALVGTTAWALLNAHAEHQQAERARSQYEFFRRLIVHDESEMSDLANRDQRISDLISEAARKLPDALQQAPEARYQLMRDVAPMLESLGHGAEAIGLLKTQAEQASRSHGASSAEAAKPLLMLAQLDCEARGDYVCAYRLVEQAYQIFLQQRPTDPEWLAGSQALVGYFGWKARGRLLAVDTAHTEQAAALLRKHPQTKSLANDALELLAHMYLEAEQPQRALDVAQEGVDFNLRALGRDNWHTANLMEIAGLAAQQTLDFGLAEQLEREALSIHAKVWPSGHYFQARGRIFLARILVMGHGQSEALTVTEEALAIMNRPEWQGRSMQKARAEAARIQVLARLGLLKPRSDMNGRCSADSPNLDAELRFTLLLHCAQAAQLSGRDAQAEQMQQTAQQLAATHWPWQKWRGAAPSLRAVEQALGQGNACGAASTLIPYLKQVPRGEAALRAEMWLGLAMCEPTRLDMLALQHELEALPQGLDEVNALLQEALGRAQWVQGQAQGSLSSLRAAVSWRRQQAAQRGSLWLARASDALAAVSPEPERAAAQAAADAAFAPWVHEMRPELRTLWRPLAQNAQHAQHAENVR